MKPEIEENNAALEFARGNAPKAIGRPYEQRQLKDSYDDQFGDIDRSTALTIPTEKELDVLMRVGKALVASGIAKHLRTAEAALTVILTGREMGLAPMASIRGIDLIMDRPFVKPILMLAVARRSGQLEKFNLVKTTQKATCTIKRRGYEEKTFTVTIQDAEKKGWAKKNEANYKSQPDTMLGHRVTGEALKDQFTDYFLGMGLPGDEGAYIEDFNDARQSFHENDTEKHVNQGEIMPSSDDGKTQRQIDEERKIDDSQYESAALEAEVVNEFIDGENKERAIALGNKLLDAGVTEDELATLTESIGGVQSIAHVAAGDGPRLIAALAQALSTRLANGKKAPKKPFTAE